MTVLQDDSLGMQKSKNSSVRMIAGALTLCTSVGAYAAPIVFTGEAEVLPVTETANGFLTDFLDAVPMEGDVISFSVTFDPDTFGTQEATGDPNTVRYTGGVTASSVTIGGVTLTSTNATLENSVLVTTSDTPALGIPGFVDGYAFTAGGDANSDDQRWAINFFFVDREGGLIDLSAPDAFPAIEDFAGVGLGYRSFRGDDFDGFGSLLLSLDVDDGMTGGNAGGGDMGGGDMGGSGGNGGSGGSGGMEGGEGMDGDKPTSVPESGTLGLLALGLLGLVRRRLQR